MKRPKHQVIYEEIRQAIESRQYAPGCKLPTETELVAQYKVSRPTVVRALRDLENEGYINRTRGKGTFVSLNETGRKGVFGVVIPNMWPAQQGEANIFLTIFDAMGCAARKAGYSFLFNDSLRAHSTEDLLFRIDSLCHELVEREVAGVFYVPIELPLAHMDKNIQFLDRFKQSGIPVVLLDREIPSRIGQYDWVGIDNRDAGKLLGEHLLSTGSRAPLFLTKPAYASSVEDRIMGVRDTMGEEAQLVVARIEDSNLTAINDLLDTNPTCDAVICRNDSVAFLVQHCLRQRNSSTAKKIRVAGFDDSHQAAIASPPLTSYHQPATDIGRIAMRTMLDRIEEPTLPSRKISLSGALQIRESTAIVDLATTA